MGKRIFLRGRLPYARENKKGTKRLTLKRNANVASLPLLFLMRKARTHKAKGFRLARIYPSFGAQPHSVSCPRGEVSDASAVFFKKSTSQSITVGVFPIPSACEVIACQLLQPQMPSAASPFSL